MIEAAIYRVCQFFSALRAGDLGADDLEFVRNQLSLAQQHLFLQMPASDQQHAVAVAQTLLRQGWSDSELIQAALLHDVGKAKGGLGLPYRVSIVLLQTFMPSVLVKLSTEGQGWRRPYYVHQHHPEIGARLAADAGSSPRVVELISKHQVSVLGQERNEWLMALKAADASH